MIGTETSVGVASARPEFEHRKVILAAMCLALVMVVAGVSMLATSLPQLAADLGASQSSQQWIVDAYALALAALLLPAGAIGDRFGRRGALIAGVTLFGAASALAAAATTPNQLIALRAVMGIGAALLMPGTLSTITSVFPEGERAKAVGIWAGFASGGRHARDPRFRCVARTVLLGRHLSGHCGDRRGGARRHRPRRPVDEVDRTRRVRPARLGRIGSRHRAARARDHRGAGPGLDERAHIGRPHRSAYSSSSRSCSPSCAPPRRCSTRGCSRIPDSQPGRRRCSFNSSRCSRSSSCRSSTSNRARVRHVGRGRGVAPDGRADHAGVGRVGNDVGALRPPPRRWRRPRRLGGGIRCIRVARCTEWRVALHHGHARHRCGSRARQ